MTTTIRMRYPWSNWTDGKIHTIYRGTDYHISTYNMQISLHGRARSGGMTVETSSQLEGDQEGLRFRFKEIK